MIQLVSRFFIASAHFFVENWNDAITIGAFAISLLDLALHIVAHRKENIKLHIEQDVLPAYSFPFVWYGPYDVLICHIKIDNYSRQPITPSDFRLTAPGGVLYDASEYNIGDPQNEDGLTLYYTDDHSQVIKLDVKTENILLHPRLEANDSKSGYLVFFDVPPVDKTTTFRLSVSSGKKRYSVPIVASPLPDNVTPFHRPNK